MERGLKAFLDHEVDGLHGNGRACADCHMPTNSFQLSPASVEARYQLLQFCSRFDPKADDPLFRPIDADDFRIHGANASDYTTLRRNGLIRITFAAAAERQADRPGHQPSIGRGVVDVWRAVPSVTNVALTGPDGHVFVPRGPNAGGGYQLDARITTLQEQALQAFINHAQVQKTPAQQTLDDLNAFQLTLFSSPGVRALADAVSKGASPLPDPDPPLTRWNSRARRFSCGRARNATAVPAARPTVAAGRPFPRYQHHLSTSGGYRIAAAVFV